MFFFLFYLPMECFIDLPVSRGRFSVCVCVCAQALSEFFKWLNLFARRKGLPPSPGDLKAISPKQVRVGSWVRPCEMGVLESGEVSVIAGWLCLPESSSQDHCVWAMRRLRAQQVREKIDTGWECLLMNVILSFHRSHPEKQRQD